MGTNFYVHVPGCPDACQHCPHRGTVQIHLGKRSSGWAFGHRAYVREVAERNHQSWPFGLDFEVKGRKDWLRLLDLGSIVDENGICYTREQLLAEVEQAQGGVHRWDERALKMCGPIDELFRSLTKDDFQDEGYDFTPGEFS